MSKHIQYFENIPHIGFTGKTQPDKKLYDNDIPSCIFWSLCFVSLHVSQLFPGGTGGKEPACQCR